MEGENQDAKPTKIMEQVNHPVHYQDFSLETIDMIERIWGTDTAATWCEITAFKYSMRAGSKDGNPAEQDLAKRNWYLDKRKQLESKSNKIQRL